MTPVPGYPKGAIAERAKEKCGAVLARWAYRRLTARIAGCKSVVAQRAGMWHRDPGGVVALTASLQSPCFSLAAPRAETARGEQESGDLARWG